MLHDPDDASSWIPASRFFLFDANGNVSQVLKDSGAITAAYTYDPFGNVTEMAGAEAESNPWRFSTKPVDTGTAWLYYGYRWYDGRLGRWPNRDPIGERGGINLYGFVGNNGVGEVDVLGLDFWNGLDNYLAGIGDSLTAGLTRQARSAINYKMSDMLHKVDSAYEEPAWEDFPHIDPGSGAYISGEITEIAVEIAVTCGGGALRQVAQRSSRYALEGGARQLFRRTHGLRGGYVHHWTSIKGHPAASGRGNQIARYPLPFNFAARGFWNMVHVKTRQSHYQLHRIEQAWERVDEFRESTLLIRQAINRISMYLGSRNQDDYEIGIQGYVAIKVEALSGGAANDAMQNFANQMQAQGIPPNLW